MPSAPARGSVANARAHHTVSHRTSHARAHELSHHPSSSRVVRIDARIARRTPRQFHNFPPLATTTSRIIASSSSSSSTTTTTTAPTPTPPRTHRTRTIRLFHHRRYRARAPLARSSIRAIDVASMNANSNRAPRRRRWMRRALPTPTTPRSRMARNACINYPASESRSHERRRRSPSTPWTTTTRTRTDDVVRRRRRPSSSSKASSKASSS